MNDTPDRGTIADPRDQCIAAIRRLAQQEHHQRQAPFLVEGISLLQMALEAGVRPLAILYCQEQAAAAGAMALVQRFRQANVETLSVSARVMHALSERSVPQGILASFRPFWTTLDALSPAAHALIPVLDDVQDPGAVGTLIRTADAVDATAVVLGAGSADPFDPKAVRGSMGSLFNVPLVQAANLSDNLALLQRQGFQRIGICSQAKESWGRGVLTGRVALVLTSEQKHHPPQRQDELDRMLSIPHIDQPLDTAIAGSIAMYAWLQENMAR